MSELALVVPRRLPEHPPYGGAFAEIVPRLTVAESRFEEAAQTVERWLPLRSRAERAVLLEHGQADHRREFASFELAEA